MSETQTTQTPASPAAAEAAGATTVTVRWRDLEPFKVPLYRDDWTFAAVVAAERGNRATLLTELLPPATQAAFVARNPTGADGFSLLDAIGEAIGMADAGESSASSS